MYRHLILTLGLASFVSVVSADSRPTLFSIGKGAIVYGVSGDGTTVVGRAEFPEGTFAFRWTAATGIVSLGDVPGGPEQSYATSVSFDGAVVVGTGKNAENRPMAFKWTAPTGLVSLGDLPGGYNESYGEAVSANGIVAAGTGTPAQGNLGFRHTDAGGMVATSKLPGAPGSDVRCTSADGAVVAGDSGVSIFREDAFGPMAIPGISTGENTGLALAMSYDGNVLVGESNAVMGKSATHAFRWTESTGTIDLGDLPGGFDFSAALAVSADGSIVVGKSSSAASGVNVEAIIWDAENGMRSLKDVLESLGLNLSGWTLSEATGISADGKTIVGRGIGPSGVNEGWVAVIPEPGTAWLLAALTILALRECARTALPKTRPGGCRGVADRAGM